MEKNEHQPITHESDSSLRQMQAYVARRLIAHTIGKLPSELVHPEYSREQIERLGVLMNEGYGAIVPYPHFSRRETFDVPAALIRESDTVARAELLQPVAYHQNKLPLRVVGTLTDFDRELIVTEETIRSGKNITKPPLAKRLQDAIMPKATQAEEPKTLKAGHGMKEYIKAAGEVLAHQGIVFIAPQGGRKTELGAPQHKTVEGIIRTAKIKGTGKVAIMPVSVAIKDVEKYTPEMMGYNFDQTYQMTFGATRTVQEYEVYAKEQGHTIDQQIFQDIAVLLPDSYRSS